MFADFEDIFGGLGDIFGFGDMFGGGRRRGGPQRGADLRYDLEIAFEQAAKGAETTIQIPRQESCETCSGIGRGAGHRRRRRARSAAAPGQLRYQQGFFTVARTCGQCRGTGKVITKPCADVPRQRARSSSERKLTVKIPAGIATGQRLRLTGEGEAGTAADLPGDLYVVIHVAGARVLPARRQRPALRGAAALHDAGARRRDQGARRIDGDETVKVPEGTQTGHHVPLARQGHARRRRAAAAAICSSPCRRSRRRS